ncbi:MAG: sugar phosphate isomerase/epimerase family protein [Actinomycetes bacterium]
MSLRFGYGLNGFAGHRVEDALAVVAGLGYDGVALTLDHPHLDPFADDLRHRTARVGRLLRSRGLDVVVETGGRYVLDPRRKHEPTLLSEQGRERRVELLRRAIQVAADLEAPAVSLWSGAVPEQTCLVDLWDRLLTGFEDLLPLAERAGVVLAVEPEPGMFLDRLDGVLELRRRLGEPDALGVTLDIGHLRCNETATPAACVRAAGSLVANVQIDDMRRGVHEHLELGTGEVEFPPVLAALEEVGYSGLVSVELPRHSHAAPAVAASSIQFLRDVVSRLSSLSVQARRVPAPRVPVPALGVLS